MKYFLKVLVGLQNMKKNWFGLSEKLEKLKKLE